MVAKVPHHPTITLLQTSSLTSVVQGELERMILSGELAPGAKLTEMALATRLGVSGSAHGKKAQGRPPERPAPKQK